MANHTWFRSEFEKAKTFNSELPPYARLVVSSPASALLDDAPVDLHAFADSTGEAAATQSAATQRLALGRALLATALDDLHAFADATGERAAGHLADAARGLGLLEEVLADPIVDPHVDPLVPLPATPTQNAAKEAP